jgi:hypothetical protein
MPDRPIERVLRYTLVGALLALIAYRIVEAL